jgi:hypothetical protein
MKSLLILFAGVLLLNSFDNRPYTFVLTEQEKADLLFMREEEKLARDIYLSAYERYGLQVFDHIAASEQMHMDLLLGLINTYGLTDPVGQHARGVYTNPQVQAMFDKFNSQVSASLVDALVAGASIEDVDLYDLKRVTGNTSKSDLLDVYDMLSCGSEHHLSAFARQLEKYDIGYRPQYITAEEFGKILREQRKPCGYQPMN